MRIIQYICFSLQTAHNSVLCEDHYLYPSTINFSISNRAFEPCLVYYQYICIHSRWLNKWLGRAEVTVGNIKYGEKVVNDTVMLVNNIVFIHLPLNFI